MKLIDAPTFTGVLNASINGIVSEIIKGGTGNDMLVAAQLSIIADVLIGGAGNVSLTSNAGLSTMTRGAVVDTFIVGVASLNVSSYATITDAFIGDLIKFASTVGALAAAKGALGATAIFQDFANAAAAGKMFCRGSSSVATLTSLKM